MDWKKLLHEATPYIRQAVSGVAENFIPTCEECGEMGLPIRCLGCQGFVCLEHAFVNYSSRELICIDCAGKLENKSSRGKKKKKKKPTASESGYPWNVLGVPPNASEETINKAFRQKAATCHPDKGGNQQDFQRLNDAKETAIKIVRGG
jgi:hypothetical protein